MLSFRVIGPRSAAEKSARPSTRNFTLGVAAHGPRIAVIGVRTGYAARWLAERSPAPPGFLARSSYAGGFVGLWAGVARVWQLGLSACVEDYCVLDDLSGG